ncbi:MAG: thioredoxin [Actinomycetota bacterium]
MADVPSITDGTFDAEVLDSDRPVLVDFWADWCHPCHLIDPHIEAIAGEQDKLKVVKLNLDENPEAAQRYGVMSIPTLLLFIDGVEKVRIVGARPKEAILSQVKPFL